MFESLIEEYDKYMPGDHTRVKFLNVKKENLFYNTMGELMDAVYKKAGDTAVNSILLPNLDYQRYLSVNAYKDISDLKTHNLLGVRIMFYTDDPEHILIY